MNDKREKFIRLLGLIPRESWEAIVRKEPEWQHMFPLLEKYPFGPFAVLMLALGLNDFQLTGKAEEKYWPPLADLLSRAETPKSPRELHDILKVFYRGERLHDLKLRRLRRFLGSDLAHKLWGATPDDIQRDFLHIWETLAKTMVRQNVTIEEKKSTKTIVFAMKCLGIALMMKEIEDFPFERIPIPVDSRVKSFTMKFISVHREEDVRAFWRGVLGRVRERVPIHMIHLDSLVWQIAPKAPEDAVEYLCEVAPNLREHKEELREVLT